MSAPEFRDSSLPPTIEDLQFRNFDSEDEINLYVGPDAPASSGDGLGSSPSQSPDIPQPLPRVGPTLNSPAFDFSSDARGIDIPESDIGDADTDQLLGSDEGPRNASFWTFAYYQQFFEISSRDVGRRLVGSMLPRPGDNFLQTTIRPNPDLYGPIWVAITLVFTIGICGNLSNYFASLSDPAVRYRFSFHTVNIAATAIVAYWFLVPSALHLLFWWRKSRCNVTYLESICLYGYSLAVYVPICWLWLVPVPILQKALVVAGMILSGSVLVMTFWPTVKNDDKRVALAIVAGILAFHGLLALGFLLYFFQVPSIPAAAVTSAAPGNVSTISTTVSTTISTVASTIKTTTH